MDTGIRVNPIEIDNIIKYPNFQPYLGSVYPINPAPKHPPKLPIPSMIPTTVEIDEPLPYFLSLVPISWPQTTLHIWLIPPRSKPIENNKSERRPLEEELYFIVKSI